MKVILFLILPFILFAQPGKSIEKNIFYDYNAFTMSTGDTIPSITSADSVEVQMGYGGPWKLLTQVVSDTAMVTADDKSAETAVVFNLAAESYWSNVGSIRFRIFSTGVDTITSYWINTIELYGALTLSVEPDTSGTNTHYSKSILRGN